MPSLLSSTFVPLFLVQALLFQVGLAQAGPGGPAQEYEAGDRAHLELFSALEFPSAQECAVCHPRQYREWSVSPHAYAQISPTFNAYQATLVTLTNGTLGDFCARCHTQVGMSRGEAPVTSNANRSAVALEGITCVVCHRVEGAYGKITGRFPLEAGDIHEPVRGPRPGDELTRVLQELQLELQKGETEGSRKRRIHREAIEHPQMSTSSFCGRCHDVRLPDGFRVEDAFSEFKHADAAARGIGCQDCHMGPNPGLPSRYEDAPAALVGGRATRPQRRTNHMFVGPDSPLVHPGIFPHNAEAAELATPEQWVQFDYEAGWGTDDFEDEEPDESGFPEVWALADDRYYAREILERQLDLRKLARERGTTLLRNGYGLGEIRVTETSPTLRFEIDVLNLTAGHSVPTGLGAERNVFLQVVVKDGKGEIVFRSGDLDPNGDVRDQHSLYVHAGKLPLDTQLFNLRSSFLIRNVHGGEREQVLPANYSFDPLIFVRPSPTPSLLLGGVSTARLHKRSIEALGKRSASYSVARSRTGAGPPYAIEINLVAGQLPPHLIHAISGVGFDYGLTPRRLAEEIVANYRVLWSREIVAGGSK